MESQGIFQIHPKADSNRLIAQNSTNPRNLMGKIFMDQYSFRKMNRADISVYKRALYDILYQNMSRIAPTGNAYEEDFEIWSKYTVPRWSGGQCAVLLIFSADRLCGYFQYALVNGTFLMEEIQFDASVQGSGLFTELYRYLIRILPPQTQYVEAYANKKNEKAQAILSRLGLKIAGENKNGRSFRFRGDYACLRERYSQ